MESPQEKILKLQLVLLKQDIHLFPKGFENSQENIQEIIQIEDQELNDNLQTEVDQFLSIKPQQFKQVLDYDTHFQIYKGYENKLLEYNEIQEKIRDAQNKITETQKDISITQAFIHNDLIRDKERIQLMKVVLVQLNQNKAQAIQEIYNIETRYISEIKSIRNPPLPVEKVAEIIVLFLYNSTQSSIWIRFKQLMTNPNEFTTRLIQFKIEEVHQTPLTYARNAFERLNSEQISRCNWCAYILHKWIQYQFQIMDILNIYKEGIEEITKHQKALKLYENIQEHKLKIKNLEQALKEYQNYKQPQRQDQEEKAEQVIETVKWFDKLQTIIKPKQYGIKLNNYIIKFLVQQQCPKTQIVLLLNEIMTNIFPNYTVLNYQIPEQSYQYPIIINRFVDKGANFDTLAHEMLLLVRNPIQFYNNLKQLNCLIHKAILKEEIHSLVYQIYLNEQDYQEQFIQDTFTLIHQFIVMIPNQTEFTVHSIMKILNVNKSEREAVIGIITYIKEKTKINIQHQGKLQFQGIPLIDYLINSYLEDNQNKNKLKFNEQQMEAIKDIILNERLEIDETVQNIIENYDIIYKSKEQYNEVSKGIVYIKFKIQENKEQIVILKNLTLVYTEFSNKLQVPYQELLKEKQCLENQLKILKDKDVIIKEQLDKSKKILNRPIHHGIKNYDLGFFKSLQKFNPISYFASKITLIQLGINSFTPDMIKKHLGSHSSLKKLTNLTINHLNENQIHYLELLLTEFNEKTSLSQFQARVIQNLIKRPFRIFYLKQLKVHTNQFTIQRQNLLEKQRVIKNMINLINQIKLDQDKQVMQKIQERLMQIRQNIEQCEASEKKTQESVDQFQDMQELQEYINEIQSFDTIDLCISLIHQNSTIEQEKEVQKQKQNYKYFLTKLQFQGIPSYLLQEQSKFNLLLMYLQDQYQNNKVEFQKNYQNKGLFDQIEMPILVDSLSYQNYLNTTAKTNINILMGIYSYQVFYNDFGHQIKAICIQSEHLLLDKQLNTNYQIRVLYEILHNKYGSFTLSVILQFLKQVITIQQKISNIYDILNHQINIDVENEIQFKEFQQEVYEMLNCQIKEFVI